MNDENAHIQNGLPSKMIPQYIIKEYYGKVRRISQTLYIEEKIKKDDVKNQPSTHNIDNGNSYVNVIKTDTNTNTNTNTNFIIILIG